MTYEVPTSVGQFVDPPDDGIDPNWWGQDIDPPVLPPEPEAPLVDVLVEWWVNAMIALVIALAAVLIAIVVVRRHT